MTEPGMKTYKQHLEQALSDSLKKGKSNVSIRTSGKPELNPITTSPAQPEGAPVSVQPAVTTPAPAPVHEPEPVVVQAEPMPSRMSVMDLGGISLSLIRPKLQEFGKIKIGTKGEKRTGSGGNEYRVPKKLDHFLIVKNKRDAEGLLETDAELMALLGDSPRALDITFLSNQIQDNFVSYLAAYSGRKCFCYGNGEVAYRLPTYQEDGKKKIIADASREQCKCPCDLFPRSCKAHGILTCVLSKCPHIGGVYKFRTTSVNSISAIQASLQLISVLTGGMLSGLPLLLVLSPMTSEVDGKQQTFQVVNVVYKGDAEALMLSAIKQAERKMQHTRLLEEQVHKMLVASTPDVAPDDDADVQQEFHPGQDGQVPA